MTTTLVTVILDRYDGAQHPYVKGTATWTPSQEFPDVPDQMLIGMAPVTATFRAGSLPSVIVVANDTAGPQGESLPGWTWNVTYSGVPGNPADASYYVLSTNGLTQHLSSLAATPAAQPGQMYMPLPSGAMTPGAVPVVQADGSVAWSTAVILDTTGGF